MIVTPTQKRQFDAARATAQAALEMASAALQQIDALAAQATLPPPDMAYLPHVLARAGGDDWSLFDAIEGAPVFADGAVSLNGVTDALVATESVDYNGKSLWAVVRVEATNNTRDTAFQINAGINAMIGVQAKTAGEFEGLLRLPSVGYGATFVTPVDFANEVTNTLGQTVVIGLIFHEDGYLYQVYGPHGIVKVTRPASVAMQKIIFGRDTGVNYTAAKGFEFILLDTTDPQIMASYLDDVAARFGVTVPLITPLMGKTIAVFGDSVAHGLSASTLKASFQGRVIQALLARRASYAIAGGQVSSVGLADPEKLALCGARVMTRDRLAGKAAALVFAGSNDWGGADGKVPVGALGDVTEATLHGSLHLMLQGFLANRDPGAKLYICTTVNLHTTVANTTGATVLDFDAALRAFVAATADTDVVLIDARLAGLTPADFPPGDFHPNDAGHAKIAEAVLAGIAADFEG